MKLLKRIAVSAAVIILCYFIIAIFFPEKIYNAAVGLQRSSAGLTEKEITAGADKIVYLDSGNGSEVLILLHGFGADKDGWTRMAKSLKGYRIVVPDIPGFGNSTKDINARYDVGSQVERLDRFFRELGLNRFFIAGNSMGGNIAGIYSIRYPQKVKGCILLNNSGIVTPEKSALIKLFEKGENPLLVNNKKDYDRLMNFIFVKAPFMPFPIGNVFYENSIKNRSFNDKIFKDLMTYPAMIDQNYAGLTMPVFIIWGDRDQLIDVSGVAVMEKNIKKVSSHIFKECGHVPMMERPEETADIIRLFIEANR